MFSETAGRHIEVLCEGLAVLSAVFWDVTWWVDSWRRVEGSYCFREDQVVV